MEKPNKFSLTKKDFLLIILSSLISLGIGYFYWFVDKEPDVTFDILSNTEVFSVNTQVDNLTVKYGNQDLSRSKKKLVLLTIRFSNEGDDVLNENDYFTKTPLGLKILNGKIADDPEIINASNEVLKKYTPMVRKGLDSIIIDKPPLAIDDFITFKILTITDRNSNEVKLESFGNISGTKKITINETYKKVENKPKSNWDQILIVFGYILVGLLSILILYWLLHPRDMNIPMDLKNRKIVAERYLEKYPPNDDITPKIVEFYVNHGLSSLRRYDLSNGLKHYYWNEFPYNTNRKEEFDIMRKFLLELEKMGYLEVNEDTKTINLDEKVQQRMFGTLEIISSWHDRMNRGFAFG